MISAFFRTSVDAIAKLAHASQFRRLILTSSKQLQVLELPDIGMGESRVGSEVNFMSARAVCKCLDIVPVATTDTN